MEEPKLLRTRSQQIACDAAAALRAQRDTFLTQGVSTASFAVGVANALLTAFVIGRTPQHYWLLHALKGLVYFPIRIHRARQQKTVPDLLELCWVANAGIVLYLLIAAANELLAGALAAPATSRRGFLIVFMLGAGPLGWSVSLLNNALIFHSVDHMASLFIHAGPFLTAWSLLGTQPATVAATYPQLGAMLAGLQEEPPSWPGLLVPALLAYLAWWLPSVLLHVASTVDLLYVREFEPKLRKILRRLSSRRLVAFIFCTVHLALCVAAFLGALLMYYSYALFTVFGLTMLVSALWNGAARYNYYLVDAYSKKLHRAIETSLTHGGGKSMY